MISERQALRDRLRAARRAIRPEVRRSAEAVVAARLLRALGGRRCVGLYAAEGSELSVDAFAAAAEDLGARVAWPRVEGDRIVYALCTLGALVGGYRGIREPPPALPALALADLDGLLVPGLGFDRGGGRLGQGGGFYDRLLASPDLRARTIGVAFAAQIIPRVPRQATDRAVAWVVTELGVAADGVWLT